MRRARPNARVLAGLLLAISTLGCRASGETAAEVEIGKGELTFAPLADEEALPYVAGAQGGHHVFVSFRVRGLDPERVLVEVSTAIEGQPDLELMSSGRLRFDADEAAGAPYYVYAGWPAQISMAPCHVGELASVAVTLRDRQGRSASADKTIELAEGDGAAPQCPTAAHASGSR